MFGRVWRLVVCWCCGVWWRWLVGVLFGVRWWVLLFWLCVVLLFVFVDFCLFLLFELFSVVKAVLRSSAVVWVVEG